MKFQHIIFLGSIALAPVFSHAAPIKKIVKMEVGYGQAQFEDGESAKAWFPSISAGLSKQISNKFYVKGFTGVELAALPPGNGEIGGNMFRGKAELALSYRLPITAIQKTRFFLTAFADVAYGSYGTLHNTRWDYVWDRFDDVSRLEVSGGAKISAEYRPSVEFGALVGGSCDVSFNSTFQGCRAGLGFKF
jgi:hypothetical protein